MNYGVIDIGSNTIRLNVYKDDKLNKTLFSKKNVAGLASYIDNGKLNERGIKKLVKVLNSHKKLLNFLSVDKVFLFATASLRNVSNHKEIIKTVKKETEFDIELISDKDEANLGYLGACQNYNFKSGITLDIGGGSTEVVSFENGKVTDIYNLDEGSLSIYTKFTDGVLPDVGEYKKIGKYLESKIDITEKSMNLKEKNVIGMGGSIRAVGNILQEMNGWYHNLDYDLEDILDLQRRIIVQDPQALKIILQVVPERIHTITAGSMILSTILKKLNCDTVHVSNIGLREGYLLNKISK